MGEFGPNPAEAPSKSGTGGVVPFYMREGITIYHADCRNVLPSLPSESIDFVLTDPPYLVNYVGRFDRKHAPIAGDGDPSWVIPVFAEIYRLLRPDSLCMSFYGWPQADVFLSAFKAVGFRAVSHLVFVKQRWGLGRFTRNRHETAFLLSKGSPAIPDENICDTVEWEQEPESWHPNQKPVKAILPLVVAYAPVDGIVLDPFMGSGSTLRAAKDAGCQAIGIELDRGYCERAEARLARGVLFAGRSASRELAAGGLFREWEAREG